MKTGQLISQLAADTRPVAPNALVRRLLLATAIGSIAALACVIMLYGLRHDLSTAVLGTSFWIKAGFTTSLAVCGFLIVERAARPGIPLTGRFALLIIPVAFIIAMASSELASVPSGERVATWLGATWRSCPFSIAALSIPALVLLLRGLMHLAPTRPMAAGFAAGILSGGLAATAYGLHCPETSAAFFATWYALGVMISGAIGAIAGRRLLHW